MTTYFYVPTYKIEFWSGSTKLFGFGYSYSHKQVVSFRIKPGFTKAIGSFEITLADTGSDATSISTGNAFKNIAPMDTVKFWWGYTGSGLTPTVAEMFVGKIDTKEVEFSTNGYFRTFIGRDTAEPALRILQRRMFTGSTTAIVKGLRDASGLSSNNTYIDNDSTQFVLVLDNNDCHRGLSEISDFVNKDYYVDTGSILHWFDRQSGSDVTTTFEEGVNIFSYRYLMDVNEVKNKIYAFGVVDDSLLSGSHWPTNWDQWTDTGSGADPGWTGWVMSSSGVEDTGVNILFDTTNKYTGSASLYIQWPVGGTEMYTGSFYLRKALAGYQLPLKINSGDALELRCRIDGYPQGISDAMTPYIRLETDASNYYECKLDPELNIGWTDPNYVFRNIPLGPNAEGISMTGSADTYSGSYKWYRVGNPDWYNINYLAIVGKNMHWNVGGSAAIYYFVDALHFVVPFQYSTSSATSITAYGLREDIIKDGRITSNEHAKNYAVIKLNDKKIPPINIEVETIARPITVGVKYPVKIYSEGIDAQFELIDIEYIWRNNTLRMKCVFTNQLQTRVPIPIINYPVQQAERQKSFWEMVGDNLGWVAKRMLG